MILVKDKHYPVHGKYSHGQITIRQHDDDVDNLIIINGDQLIELITNLQALHQEVIKGDTVG